MTNKHKITFCLLIGISVFASSCFTGRKYERQELPAANLYRTDDVQNYEEVSMADSNTFGALSWRQLFTDTILQNYMAQALENNLDVQIALRNIDAAAAYVKQNKAAFGPTVSASLNYSYAKNPKYTNGITDGSLYQLGTNLSWEADIWGKIRSQKNASEAAYLQTIEAQRAITSQLIAQMASIYYQIITLDEQIEIAHLSILTRDSSLQTTKALMQGGQLTAVAIEQTKAQVYDAQNILLNLKKQRRVLENAFCLLLNEPAHEIRRGSMEQQIINTPLAIGVPAQLLANRPDVRQAEFALMQALELTNVAKANFYPSLVITAGAGFREMDIKNWLTPEGIFAQVAGGLLQPILNRRLLKTAHEVAQTREVQALLTYQKMLLIAGNEVSDALYDYQTQNESVELQEKQYQALKTAVNYSQQLLVNGLANYLEVLTAQQNVLVTELNLSNTKYRRLLAIIQLYQALGGGWQ